MDVKYEVVADLEKNRLYITFGNLTDDERETIVTKIWEKAQSLKPGWGCIVNYTNVTTKDVTEIAMLHISDALQVFEALKMGQLVRVISPQQLDEFKEIKKGIDNLSNYEATEVDTLDKANAILDTKG